MTNIQCCEDGWGHALKIANSQTHNTLLFMIRPVVCVCVLSTIQLCGYVCISGFSISVTGQWSLYHMRQSLPAADGPKCYSPTGQCQTPYTKGCHHISAAI